MKLYDATRPIEVSMPIYGDEPRPEITKVKRRAKGDAYNLTKLAISAHTGTHVDAPCHFIEGAPGVETWPPEQLCGPAVVVAIPNERSVQIADLERAALPRGTERVLLKTPNGELWEDRSFHADYVYLEPDAARWLVARGVRLVGIDYLSVEKYGSKEPATHLALLENRVAILEGADLREVPPGPCELFCLPIKLVGSDGGPARVIIRA